MSLLGDVSRAAASVLRSRVRHLASLPVPYDVPRVHVPGRAPHRLLLAGSGPAVGFGTTTHQLALPGHLARALALLTGCGVDLDVAADAAVNIDSITSLVNGLTLWRYDSVVISLGDFDAVEKTSVDHWRTSVAALFDRLDAAVSFGTRVIVIGMRSAECGEKSATSPAMEQHLKVLNGITADLARAKDRIEYLALPDPQEPDRDIETSASRVYREWAEVIAPVVSAQLTTAGSGAPICALPPTAQWLRNQPHDEGERQSSLDALCLLEAEHDPEIDRLVELARATYGTKYAAFGLIDRDDHWVRAAAGFEGARVPRSGSFCATTIRHELPLVVPDARSDLHFFEYPFVTEGLVRFYAGYPVESPDGMRIGALCVLDPEPRDAADIDIVLLQRLAHEIQNRLWAGANRP